MAYFQQFGRKYKNINQVYNGIRYDSKLEANRAKGLDLLVKAKEIKKWIRQVTLPLYFNEHKICNYRIDFVLFENDGSYTLEEVKGMELPLWKMKWKILEAIVSKDCPERRIICEAIGIKHTKNMELKLSVIK